MNITILGAGAFGKALGKILIDNGHQISYYDPAVYPEIDLDMALYHANTVVIAIPSIFLLDFIDNYPDKYKNIPTILTSKGLFNADIFADFPQFSVISGPAFASEIMEGKPATFTASGPYPLGLFKNSQISIELCEDMLGIILCGTLKNIYAIGAGYHSDSQDGIATFIEHAHNETAEYLEKHGADRRTADLACGLGDLILTSMNDNSRNFTFGKGLKAGRRVNDLLNELQTVEGYSAAQIVDTEGYPLLSQIQDIISQNMQN